MKLLQINFSPPLIIPFYSFFFLAAGPCQTFTLSVPSAFLRLKAQRLTGKVISKQVSSCGLL